MSEAEPETSTAASQVVERPPFTPTHGNGSLLKPWQPGQSGNPKGRPPSPTRDLKRILRSREPNSGLRYSRLFAKALVDAALAGDVNAMRVILDRVDGPVAQKLDLTAVVAPVIQLALPVSEAPELPGPQDLRTIDVTPQPAVPAVVTRADDSPAVA